MLDARYNQTWAMLIKRVYEVYPLTCGRCGGQMKVIAFIEPPRGDVIEKILQGTVPIFAIRDPMPNRPTRNRENGTVPLDATVDSSSSRSAAGSGLAL